MSAEQVAVNICSFIVELCVMFSVLTAFFISRACQLYSSDFETDSQASTYVEQAANASPPMMIMFQSPQECQLTSRWAIDQTFRREQERLMIPAGI